WFSRRRVSRASPAQAAGATRARGIHSSSRLDPTDDRRAFTSRIAASRSPAGGLTWAS
ncbi:MAG: hypothetical protein AVDCRST_MAG67-2504, partial [uncultured Solirubrobacteraceae bacterium]